MKKILTVTLLTLFFLSSISFAGNSNLMHQSHEKIRETLKEMEVIWYTSN